MIRLLPLFILLLFPPSAFAIEFGNPVRCIPNTNCWIINYVDHDASSDWRDYQCHKKSYDKHNGTDIAVATLKDMHKGVAVLAAANGTVRTTRDDMEDLGLLTPPEKLKNKACGNAIILSHDNGWETRYCHLMRHSINVKPGDKVIKGQKIGLIGYSGRTEFPHLHFSVRHMGETIDPFTNTSEKTTCNAPSKGTLWDTSTAKAFTYASPQIYLQGFSTYRTTPEIFRKNGSSTKNITPKSPAIVINSDILGLHPGDNIKMEIKGPDENILLQQDFPINKYRIRVFRSVGKKRANNKLWPIGEYTATVSIYRKGQRVEHLSTITKIEK